MKKTISFCEFCDSFEFMERGDSFSYNGKRALFDYIETLEEETGTGKELDIIALCCEYEEHASIKDAFLSYKCEDEWMELGEDDEQREEKAKEWLEDRTTVLAFDAGVIIASF